ncbi:ribbon-helix-helix domain-containing protein [Brevibacillus panacihumi]|uniref:ribbon-helix-helix domain-containing protein n=1 Tax=Brevibacillus panacihumi TaxID=497735 RepID=UPI003D1CD002
MFPRRKRNLDIPGVPECIHPKESVYGIDWDVRKKRSQENGTKGLDTESRRFSEEMDNHESDDHSEGYQDWKRQTNLSKRSIDQVDAYSSSLKKRPDFYEQHKKVTIYVEKELMGTIRQLKKERYIPSYSWLVAEAIKQYLDDRK